MARLYLTGGLRLDGPTGSFTDVDLPGKQGRLAFAALAVERRPLSQDQLADILWDERPPSQWKTALSPIVSKTRALISGAGLDGGAVLSSSGRAYELRLPGDIWVDLEHAHRCLDRSEGAMRHDDLEAAAHDATVASSILRRPFLVGVDNGWVDRVRDRLDDALYRCSIVLATAWNQLGDHQLAATAAETAIQIDPLRELAHRLLMEAEHARGDDGAALRAFSRCERTLADELDVSPSAETLELVERIRRRSV